MISSEAPQNNGWESSFSVVNPTNPYDSSTSNIRQSTESLLPLLRQRHLNSSIGHQSELNEYGENSKLTRNSLGGRFSSVVLHSLKRNDSSFPVIMEDLGTSSRRDPINIDLKNQGVAITDSPKAKTGEMRDFMSVVLAAAKQQKLQNSLIQRLELVSNSSLGGISLGGPSSTKDYTPSQNST